MQRVARNYLHPDRLTIVLVGDASAFVKQLPGAGFDKFEVIPASELDLAAADLRRKPARRAAAISRRRWFGASRYSRQPAARRRQDAPRQGDRRQGRTRQAQGIKTVRSEGTMIASRTGKPVPFPVVTSISSTPIAIRVDADTPGGKVAQVYADGRYWVQDRPDGTSERAARGARPAIQASVQRDIIARAGQGRGRQAGRARGRHRRAGRSARIEISGDDMPPLTLFVNRDNGLIEQARYVVDAEGRSEERYSDYRNVDGIQVPFHTVVRRAGLDAASSAT